MTSDDPRDLEAELIALGDSLDAPDPAGVAAAVRARLERPEPERRRAPRRIRRWQLVAAIVLAVTAATAATPQGRAAVVQILRYAGIELRVGDPAPAPGERQPIPGERVVTLDEARRAAKFPIKLPAELGDPERVTVGDGGRVVSLTWPGGVRLDQYDGRLELVFRKDLGPPWPEETRVGATQGWWISTHHTLTYLPGGGGTPVPLRLAGPTLAWQDGGQGLRLEGVASLTRAVRIARSVR
ncbi:hypothetical protein [Nonomuraea sp. NPDC046570]|uniref:hypothetical protein n=1 Tax=Nonomuraea sp. NPDC046570 TaxID=3155255 RepID=UPI0033E3A6E6